MNTASRSKMSMSESVTSPCRQIGHADLGHALQHGIDLLHVAHAALRIGGGARRVELDRRHLAIGQNPPRHRGDPWFFGQIKASFSGVKGVALGESCHDAGAG